MQTSLKVDILNIPGATSGDIVDKIDDVLEGKPESLIVRVGTNDLINKVNFLSNVKKIVNKVKKHLSRYCAQFFKHYYQKRQKKFRKDACPYKFLIKKFLQPKKYTFDTKRQHKRRKPWYQETALKQERQQYLCQKYLPNIIEEN